jgi:hypothetical protein
MGEGQYHYSIGKICEAMTRTDLINKMLSRLRFFLMRLL